MTLGADPEFMLYDMEKGKIVSAIGVLKNDKYTPIDLGEGRKMYADNVLVEFSFPPSDCIDKFIESIRSVLQAGQKQLGQQYRLVAKAAHVYDEEELADPKAREGGCSPNFDVYAQTANLPPAFEGGLRTGSFHIHIGSSQLQTRERKDMMIKALDCWLGLASVAFDTDPTALKRRKLYGKAGEFRPTGYGVEYRVLGPYAIKSPELVRLCSGIVVDAICDVLRHNADKPYRPFERYNETAIKAAINNGDSNSADYMTGEFMRGELYHDIHLPRSPDLYRDWGIQI